jgi:hypothetical protein
LSALRRECEALIVSHNTVTRENHLANDRKRSVAVTGGVPLEFQLARLVSANPELASYGHLPKHDLPRRNKSRQRATDAGISILEATAT